MLVFEEKGKPEYPEKNLSKQRRERTTNCNYVWSRHLDLNPGHIGEAFQGGFWCRFVAHFPIHLSPIWLETNVPVVFSLQYNCRCSFFARIQMFAKRECCAIFFLCFPIYHLTKSPRKAVQTRERHSIVWHQGHANESPTTPTTVSHKRHKRVSTCRPLYHKRQ